MRAGNGSSKKRSVDAPPATPSELRAAQVAHALARAVRDEEIAASDALRILRHELRRRNTNHVDPLTVESIYENRTAEEWLAELRRVAMVVCVTAEENYRLEAIERTGVTGPEKYAPAKIGFMDPALPWATSSPADLEDTQQPHARD